MTQTTIRLVDRAGKPIAGARLEINQTSSSFPFGDQLWGMDRDLRYGQAHYDTRKYKQLRFTNLLNACNALCYWTERPRNDGPKTEDLQGDNITEYFAACVDWGNSAGLIVKGHPLFWSIPKCIPDWAQRYPVEKLMMFAEVRVRSLVARFKGKVKIWDAVNEPMWEAAPKNLAQRHWPHLEPISDIADYIAPVLKWCREEDPDALLVVNDYGMEADPKNGAPVAKDGTPATAALQRKRFAQLFAELFARGTPPDALGLQAHTAGWQTAQQQVAVYDEFAQTGLPIHITEFWADSHQLAHLPKPEMHRQVGQYICDYLTLAFGHPAVEAFFFWGFMNKCIEWSEGNSGHELTPQYEMVQALLNKTWRTHTTVTTNAEGVATFRGFHGQYTARAATGRGAACGIPFEVSAGTSTVTLTARF